MIMPNTVSFLWSLNATFDEEELTAGCGGGTDTINNNIWQLRNFMFSFSRWNVQYTDSLLVHKQQTLLLLIQMKKNPSMWQTHSMF